MDLFGLYLLTVKVFLRALIIWNDVNIIRNTQTIRTLPGLCDHIWLSYRCFYKFKVRLKAKIKIITITKIIILRGLSSNLTHNVIWKKKIGSNCRTNPSCQTTSWGGVYFRKNYLGCKQGKLLKTHINCSKMIGKQYAGLSLIILIQLFLLSLIEKQLSVMH